VHQEFRMKGLIKLKHYYLSWYLRPSTEYYRSVPACVHIHTLYTRTLTSDLAVGVKLKLVIIGEGGRREGVLYWSRVIKRKYLSGCVVVLIIIIWNGRRHSRTRDLETMGETADYHYYIQRELLSKRDKVGILPSNLPLAF